MTSEECFKSESVKETIEFGQLLGEKLKAGDVVALSGPLGSGKTHCVKGIAQALGINAEMVQSPTYSLINEYKGHISLFHFDCYRMESVDEALEIGAEEYFYDEGICVIEWPEKIEPILPDEVIWVDLESTGASERIFKILE